MANGFDWQGLLSNPAFGAGMGLLSGNQQGDPYGGLLSGLSDATRRQREEQLRREIMAHLQPQRAGQRGMPGAGMPGAGGHQAPPTTQAEAMQMRAAAMGQPPPEIPPEAYRQPYQPGTAQQGLLEGPTGSAATQVIPEQVAEDVQEVVEDVAGGEAQANAAVEQQQERMQEVAQPSVWQTPGGGFAGGDPQEAMQLFSLLAQYGDPQKAAEGYLNYQLGQQRLQIQIQAQQARSSGFNIQWDDQNLGWFPHRDPVTGRTTLTPARTPDGTQIKRDPKYETYTGAGGVQFIPTTGLGGAQPGSPGYAVTPQQAGAGAGIQAEYQNQIDLRASFPSVQQTTARELQRIEEFRTHEATEMMTSPGSRTAYDIGRAIPGVGTIVGMATGGADWEQRRQQLMSGAFVTSIRDIKAQAGGIGPISEIEGQKLESTLLRLQTAVDAQAFNNALDDLALSLRKIEREHFERAYPGMSYDETFSGDAAQQREAGTLNYAPTEDEQATYDRIMGTQ